MAKFTDGGWVPADDPMFNGSWMIFGVRPKPLTENGQPESSSEQAPKQQKPAEERQMTRNLVEAYRFAVTFNHISRAARLIHRSAFAID